MWSIWTTIWTLVLSCQSLLLDANVIRERRSIDLNAAHALIPEQKLPQDVIPTGYKLELQPFPDKGNFKGHIKINITWLEPTSKITLHVHSDVTIAHADVFVTQIQMVDADSSASTTPSTPIKVLRTERVPKRPWYVIHLMEPLQKDSHCTLEMTFTGKLVNDTSEGLFRNSYVHKASGEKRWFVATHMRPNNARRVFPCFDEPSLKAPFEISIARQENMRALSNMPLSSTDEISDQPGWVWDHFMRSPPMSTFTVGIVVSDLDTSLDPSSNVNEGIKVKVWGREDYLEALSDTTRKVEKVLKVLQGYWGVPYPLPKLDCVALPNYQAVRPADNWGLIIFKESELSSRGVWNIAQEVAYQWLGDLTTPFWWNDAHINKALASYLAAVTAFKIDNGRELQGKWPMTILYSLYYEFSKRYPHARITGMKHETTSVKTELIFRMLNYTLGEKTFRAGLQEFMQDSQNKTFFGDDVWSALTEQAHVDRKLCRNVSVNEIAASWITKDRLPVVTVTRDYPSKTAILKQRVYLRDRPHDVPDQDKLLWWVPIVLITQDNLDFSNSTPRVWMKKQREIKITNLPGDDQFIIVNPEEIGPYPVNYDNNNWNLLAQYLLKSEGRNSIPVYTRAKLLHDAWNLAYAGDLSFATALNMTLFLKYERDHLAWDPVFTMIDHIGRHIDSSEVHKKFETYVRILLTPLYEELTKKVEKEEEKDSGEDSSSEENDNEEVKTEEDPGQTHLRGLSKVFLCRAGYKPCIEEAQAAYKKWMESEDPDEGNPVANQYICPVFKWGTREEWEFGLQRVINFPSTRKQSERTYLLKTLVGCPIECWKINRILNITILEENGNFTDNDIYLVFSMLTGSAKGYTTLFTFLKTNWDTIKLRFEEKPHLWDSLITSATTVFTTQDGYDLVSELYVQRQGQFGSAEHIVEKALKNIKEETKWSDENLPVIEKWLDEYLATNEAAAKKDAKFL